MQISTTEKWWPTMGIRALELLEQGAQLTDGERAEAERERAAAARRKASPPFIKREQIKLQPSSHRGVYIGDIVTPAMGAESHILTAQIHHIPPGAHTDYHRHSERVMLVMSGSGHSIIEGERIHWVP